MLLYTLNFSVCLKYFKITTLAINTIPLPCPGTYLMTLHKLIHLTYVLVIYRRVVSQTGKLSHFTGK